jgi:hypothetical protein
VISRLSEVVPALLPSSARPQSVLNYFIGADGLLMPAKQPPELKHFGQAHR